MKQNFKKAFAWMASSAGGRIAGLAIALVLVSGVAQAATTISTNINTGGTLTVTGQSTLAQASTTGMTSTGNIWVNGMATTTASNGNFATLGTVTIGSSGTALSAVLAGTCGITPGSIAATASTTVTCTATGVAAGDKVFVTPSSQFESWLRVEGATTTANTITIQLQNASTTAAVVGAARTWSWMAIR